MLKKVALSALLLGLSSSSFANGGQQSCNWPWPFSLVFCANPGNPPSNPPTTHAAPEMDATVAIGALTLFVGGLIVLRSRRRSS